jgi:hypothetical protein
MGHPISIAVRGLKCINEQESSDEPYVITCLVNLTNKINFAGNTFFHYPVVDSRKLTITRTASVDVFPPNRRSGSTPARLEDPARSRLAHNGR